jgi:hypothetical protein
VDDERIEIKKYNDDLIEKLESKRLEIANKKKEIDICLIENKKYDQYYDDKITKAITVGRISLYLENVNGNNELSSIKSSLLDAQQDVLYHQDKLDELSKNDKKFIYNLINIKMTNLAEILNLEFTLPQYNYFYKLDLNDLTVVVSKTLESKKLLSMNSGMGSAASWLGCHLITFLTLHYHFIENNRPIPNFLVLDQPSQVYFPSEDYYKMDGNAENTRFSRDGDREAVENMFNLFFGFCELLYPKFQLIILDHANINTTKFKDSMVDGRPWNKNFALIPNDWLEQSNTEYLF